MRKLGYGLVAVLAAGVAARAQAGSPAADPYLWLEDVRGSRALQWVDEQNRVTVGAIGSDADYAHSLTAARQIVSEREVIPRDQVSGDFVFSFVRTNARPQGMWRRTTMASYRTGNPDWETLLDVNALNTERGTKAQWKDARCLAPDMTKCLVFLNGEKAGAQAMLEFDASSRTLVDGGFGAGAAVVEADWVDADTLLLVTRESSGRRGATHSAVRLWSRGRKLQDARLVFGAEATDVSLKTFVAHAPDGSAHAFFSRQKKDGTTQLIHVDAEGNPLRIMVPDNARFHGMLGGELVFTLAADWRTGGALYAAGTMFSLPLQKYIDNHGALPAVRRIYAPDQQSTVTAVSMTRDAMFVSTLEKVQGRISEFTFDGHQWSSRRLALPDFGSVDVLSSSDTAYDMMIRYASFLAPDRAYVLSRGTEPVLLSQLSPRFDASGAEVAQFEAVSKDGTKIPYFIVRRAGTATVPPTPVPTLLYAYGGFQISTTPWYWSSAGKLWLEKGGAYAIANIRGGGEFGPTWHAAATGKNRQRNFDDLAAVAEDMVARNLTTRQKLGVFGSSQGGLLAAGTFVQHPDLFAAVVAQVPLTDMLRYTALASNCTWKAEYGDPSDPGMRDIIAQWSPYQNLKHGVKYPKVLFMTSGSDTRVHPGHARKMAARMEELGQPVMYYESSEAPDADARAEQLALTFTYFRRVLME
jgi:prolyl oligopeptidase